MQDRFVGDIGDFGKYGLLRALSDPSDGNPPLKLGVVWYLTPDGTRGGNERAYLNRIPENLARYRACDLELYDALGNIERNVVAVRKAGILPEGTVFHEGKLDFTRFALGDRQGRLAHREQYVENALRATDSCDLVFVDPDTGIPSARVSRTSERGLAYSFLNELEPYVGRGQSLVVYQQFPRMQKAHWLKEKIGQLASLGSGKAPFALLYASRAFLIIPTAAHDVLLRRQAAALVNGPWKWLITPAGL